MKIYADFNGIEECNSNSKMRCLNITGFGTLSSLSLYKLRVKEGQTIVFSDPDGLSVSGTMYFDINRVSKNCSGWFAKFHSDDVYEDEPLKHDYSIHTCFTCRKNLKSHFDAVGRQFDDNCPFSRTPIMMPLSAP